MASDDQLDSVSVKLDAIIFHQFSINFPSIFHQSQQDFFETHGFSDSDTVVSPIPRVPRPAVLELAVPLREGLTLAAQAVCFSLIRL